MNYKNVINRGKFKNGEKKRNFYITPILEDKYSYVDIEESEPYSLFSYLEIKVDEPYEAIIEIMSHDKYPTIFKIGSSRELFIDEIGDHFIFLTLSKKHIIMTKGNEFIKKADKVETYKALREEIKVMKTIEMIL